MLVLSESFHAFESRIACRCNRFPSRRQGELLFLFDTSSRKVFREENHPFRRNAWTLMKFIPGVHTTWHMCVFHDQYILTNDVLHIALCVNIISFPLEFSFEFI
jgi:hypothetical protein